MSDLQRSRTELDLTAEQRLAVTCRARTIAVSAGAGTGKTRVLMARMLDALESPDLPISLGGIVALTFTEKAARELRERIRRQCRAMLRDAGSTDRPFWKSIVRGLEAAPIGTFHSFCGQLLRRFPVESGVEPGFGIVEPGVASALCDVAVASCLRRWLAEAHSHFLLLALAIGIDPLRQMVGALVEQRTNADLRVWADRTPEQVMKAWRDQWESCIRAPMLERLERLAAPLLSRPLVDDSSKSKFVEKARFLQAQLPLLRDARDLKGHLEDLRGGFNLHGNSARAWGSEEAKKAVAEAWTAFKAELDQGLKDLDWDEAASLNLARFSTALAGLADEAVEAYSRAKRQRGALDFDDLQLHARELLRAGDPEVMAWARDSARLVLVDEYQDTDPIQDEILSHLVPEDVGEASLFLVGDIKQSIYRFRRARPDLFEARRARAGGKLGLGGNFRSVPQLIAFTNILFSGEFPGEEHRLSAQDVAVPEDAGPAIEFLWAQEPPAPGAAAKQNVQDGRKLEAEWIARLLAHRFNGAEPWKIRVTDGAGEVRWEHARPGDVVILLRTLNDSAAYERALADAGIDYHVQGAAAFFGQSEVLDVINLLSTLEDPCDAVAVAATLRGPFGCVSDEALLWLSTSPHGDLCHGLNRWREVPELSADDQRAVERIAGLLDRWRSLKDHLPIGVLLERAIDESGLEPALIGEFLGERRRANVRKLVRLAREYDAQGGLTLADFVARLRADFNDPPREDEAATTDEQGQAVRLMTIHQAKGLEFPVVIVPDLNRKPGNRHRMVVLDEALGVVPLIKDISQEDDNNDDDDNGERETRSPALGPIVYKSREKVEDRREAIRVFYVATTRARDHLILASGCSAATKPASPALELLDAWFDRQTGACRNPDENAGGPVSVRVIDTAPPPARFGNRIVGGPDQKQVDRVLDMIESCATGPEWPMPATAESHPVSHLDLEPSAGLDPRLARVERLLRDLLADPEALTSSDAEALAFEWGRRQDPVATRVVMQDALRRLRAWRESPLARVIAASRGVRRRIDWITSGDRSQTVRGRTEFLLERGSDPALLVIASCAEVDEQRESLRLAAAVRAAAAAGIDRVEAWRVSLSPDRVLEIPWSAAMTQS